jgi:Mn2+/Fe2+ NRAMP family transporter
MTSSAGWEALSSPRPSRKGTALSSSSHQWERTSRAALLKFVSVIEYMLPDLRFALVPFSMFTRWESIMGGLVNYRLTTVLASIVAGLIIALNIFLLYQTFFGG